MKKTYKSLGMFVAALCVMAMNIGAQPLSGFYTINQGAATQGNNFNTFTDFAAAINTLGISGPVEVDVATGSGPYNEQVLFNQITGASAVNRITINGNGNLLTFSSSNANQRYIMGFNGADYFTVKELNMQGTGTYQYVCYLWGGANYNVFSSCSFSCNANTTTTDHIPVVLSGASNSYANAGNSGQFNTWENCTTFSGYAGFWMYGPTGIGTYMLGNSIIDCQILDFYVYGIYTYYHQEVTVTGSLMERLTRTNFTTGYGMYIYYSSGSHIEGNTVRKLYNLNPNFNATCYSIYIMGNATVGHNHGPTNIINNIVYDVRHLGSSYGIMGYYLKGDFIHNTYCIDDPTSTSQLIYGIYFATTGVMNVNAANNLVYINKGGASTKFGIYYGSTALVTSNYNNVWFGSAGTNTFAGYYGGNQTTMANLKSASGQEVNTFSLDPMFANLANNDLHPTSALLNNQGAQFGVIFDNENAIRNQSTPDIGALEFMTPNCNGTPNQFVAGASYSFCPGEKGNLGIGIYNPEAGYTYQWQVSSTSHVGPFVNVPGATGIFYTTPPLNQNVWYSVVVTCTNPGGGVAAPVATIQIAGVTTSSVHYLEDFEGIGKVNRLPNCSWYAPNIGSSAKTFTSAQSGNRLPRSGKSFATFEAGSGGTNYYYSNGIWMEPGITYSASMHFQTDFTGATNWTDLSILTGTAQSPAGLMPIASTGGPAVSAIYKLLSNTFTVSSPAFYYVAIRATASSGAAQYLTWDDLEISIPCTPIHNPVNMNITATPTNVCAGTQVNLSATGADSYVWNTGAVTAVTSATPITTTLYSVIGTNMTTKCTNTVTQLVVVKTSPFVSVYAFPPVACAGSPVTLIGGGATTYTWSSGGNGPSINVTPLAGTGYTVIGSANGCTAKASIFVQVQPLPNVSALISSNQVACVGEQVLLTALGAQSYIWQSSENSNVMQGANVTTQVKTEGLVTFTVTGTAASGCQGKGTISVVVDPCTGLSKLGASSANVKVYPNPTNGEFTLELIQPSSVEISDLSGRIVFSANASGTLKADISALATGIYRVKVSSDIGVDIIKLVKE